MITLPWNQSALVLLIALSAHESLGTLLINIYGRSTPQAIKPSSLEVRLKHRRFGKPLYYMCRHDLRRVKAQTSQRKHIRKGMI